MPLLKPGVLALALLALACGDEGTGPDLQVYTVSLAPIGEETLPDGTRRYVYRATVTDGGNLRIAGAWMRFETTAGDPIPQTDRTDLNGSGRVEWVFDAEDYADITSATLSGCAQNLGPPDCTAQPLATVSFD